jgi:hypothetical protein
LPASLITSLMHGFRLLFRIAGKDPLREMQHRPIFKKEKTVAQSILTSHRHLRVVLLEGLHRGTVRLMNSGLLHRLPEPGLSNFLEPGVLASGATRGDHKGAGLVQRRDKVSASTCDHRRATCHVRYIPKTVCFQTRPIHPFVSSFSPRSHLGHTRCRPYTHVHTPSSSPLQAFWRVLAGAASSDQVRWYSPG